MRLSLPAIALVAASGILPGCRENLQRDRGGGVQADLPQWPLHFQSTDPGSGFLERADGKGSSVRVSWDIDPRPAPVGEADLPGATQTAVSGHFALLRGGHVTWRCDRTRRLFRIDAEGPRAPGTAEIAKRVRCHDDPVFTNGDVPAAASSVLGPEWTFANRGRGTISWSRGDAVLTFFAGQQGPGPKDARAARLASVEWAAAAGLSKAMADGAEPAAAPLGHRGTLVHGHATLDGRPVKWTMLFWRCLQRQKSFAAIVFAQKQEQAGDNALLSARCHG